MDDNQYTPTLDAVLFVRVVTLLTIPQLRDVLTWTSLSPSWRAVLQQHLRWAEAAKYGIVDGGGRG